MHLDSDSEDLQPAASGPGAGSFDDDLEMARRMQEELYAEGGRGSGSGRDPDPDHDHDNDRDPDGVRAPMGRTTETLVGPGAVDFDTGPGIESEVMRQLQQRRAGPRAGAGAGAGASRFFSPFLSAVLFKAL